MTRPRRKGGATNWIDRDNMKMDKTEHNATNTIKCSGCPVAPATYSHNVPASKNDIADRITQYLEHYAPVWAADIANEVNLSPCRPVMDGLHSVNSAKLCAWSLLLINYYT